MTELWNLLINGGMLAVAAFLFKRWMDGREEEERLIRVELRAHIAEVAAVFDQSVSSIQAKIGDNKVFYRQTYEDIKFRLEDIAGLQRIANGRTGKLETRLERQIAVCEERNRLTACGPVEEAEKNEGIV
jgi:hypothetical protein